MADTETPINLNDSQKLREVQGYLDALGMYDYHTVDGLWGGATKGGLEDFANEHSLDITFKGANTTLSQDFLTELKQAAKEANPSLYLQKMLNENGVDIGPEDGIVGPKTRRGANAVLDQLEELEEIDSGALEAARADLKEGTSISADTFTLLEEGVASLAKNQLSAAIDQNNAEKARAEAREVAASTPARRQTRSSGDHGRSSRGLTDAWYQEYTGDPTMTKERWRAEKAGLATDHVLVDGQKVNVYEDGKPTTVRAGLKYNGIELPKGFDRIYGMDQADPEQLGDALSGYHYAGNKVTGGGQGMSRGGRPKLHLERRKTFNAGGGPETDSPTSSSTGPEGGDDGY